MQLYISLSTVTCVNFHFIELYVRFSQILNLVILIECLVALYHNKVCLSKSFQVNNSFAVQGRYC